MTTKPMVLIILDGWGYQVEPQHNAIAQANTPTWDNLWENYPHSLLEASNHDVGLPQGQMGNSEVGHLNIGAGRIVYQDLTRIDKAISDGSFNENKQFLNAINNVNQSNNSLHIFGLLSAGGVHSSEQQIFKFIKLAKEKNVKNIYVHAFLDGRDTPPKCALQSLQALEKCLGDSATHQIASITGRYYAMDRDNRWERIQPVYDMLTQGKAPFYATTAESALKEAYQRNETDEFVQPTLINKDSVIKDGDAIVFMNFRADRARQLTKTFVLPDFDGFHREVMPKLSCFLTLTEYEKGLPVDIAYAPEKLDNVLGEYLSKLNLKQLRVAETEKYAHVTFFFNGGVEKPFPGEKRKLIASPKVATYDLQPEMSAPKVTETLVKAIASQQYDVIICNYANADMVGHTGNFKAAKLAVEALDQCLSQILEALDSVQGECLITADHGNVERMYDEKTKQAITSHSTNPVPFIYYGKQQVKFAQKGVLSDIAPTILNLMGLNAPSEMQGKSIKIN